MADVKCHECHRPFGNGEGAWASDWVIVNELGARKETRYYCDPCHEAMADADG